MNDLLKTYSNQIHNVLNALMAVSAVITAVLVGTGCVTVSGSALDCTNSWLPPQYISWGVGAVGAMASIKLYINKIRDGFGGMLQTQPPVTPVALVDPVAPVEKCAP